MTIRGDTPDVGLKVNAAIGNRAGATQPPIINPIKRPRIANAFLFIMTLENSTFGSNRSLVIDYTCLGSDRTVSQKSAQAHA